MLRIVLHSTVPLIFAKDLVTIEGALVRGSPYRLVLARLVHMTLTLDKIGKSDQE